MTASNNGLGDKIKGKANQVKGEIKDQIGKATNNESLQGEGKLDKAKGIAQEKIGELKNKISK
ncbi:CsbD family protein [Paenibacillus sp. BIHB 4019]|uniref:CsbD family protein n=1 Tax=Paenibacillus sp. BIHB 4019 TaxID=1870819 RepID=A0A1B2DBM9_9BACL|nr:CsbD family protein [Paenibacillus sp. BIHB 4019]ANY65112.1 CsbD family protein [Paenibacillus sp. BIHB 4019]